MNGQPYAYGTPLGIADLNALTFRPAADYTGPMAFGFRGTGDGTTWTSQIQVGGRIAEAAGLADLIRVLQLLAGAAVLPPEGAAAGDVYGDGQFGPSEAVYILQGVSGVRA